MCTCPCTDHTVRGVRVYNLPLCRLLEPVSPETEVKNGYFHNYHEWSRFHEKYQKQKNFYILIVSSFNQNRLSLRSNVSGGFRHKCRRLPPSRWRFRLNYYQVILVQGIFSAPASYDPTTSWPAKTKIWLVQRFKPRRFENIRFFLIWPVWGRNTIVENCNSQCHGVPTKWHGKLCVS